MVDVNNHPIQNAEIKIGTSTVQTDVNGVFIINGASVHEKFAYITATKSGYIDGSRAMVPTSGKNNVKIMLIANTPLQTIQSGVDSEVALPYGTKVSFDGEFQDENGAAYAGTVSVSMFHLLPSDENIDKLMPGMLYAQTKTNQEAVLETFGMLNVELRGSAGQKLNIKEGHTAKITLKIDDSQTATAPSSIPLWHFDEAKGYWKEDGVATKVGNNYVGEVSHFSWWNCDITFPGPLVILNITVVDSNGNGISNVGVELAIGSNSPRMVVYTNTNGHASGLIPANQTLTLNLYTSYDPCDTTNILYTETIGPFSVNTTLPNIIIVNTSTIMSSNITGNLITCDDTNVTNGYVMLTRPSGVSFSAVNDGAFSFNEIYCPSNTLFNLKGIDFVDAQQTGTISYNFTAPVTNIGNLQVCSEIYGFISYQIDLNPPVFIVQNLVAGSAGAGGSGGSNFLIYGSNSVTSFHLLGASEVLGVYNYGSGFSITTAGVNISTTLPNTIEFTISKFGAIGEYIDLTFNGTYTDSVSGAVRSITGVVHTLRTN